MSEGVTCRHCGYRHDYVRGRCPKCGTSVLPENRPEPSGCTRIMVGCLVFPLGFIGTCMLNPNGSFATASIALIVSLILVGLADNALVSRKKKSNDLLESHKPDRHSGGEGGDT